MLWRMAIMSIGFTITAIGIWLWVKDAIDEYRNLPTDARRSGTSSSGPPRA